MNSTVKFLTLATVTLALLSLAELVLAQQAKLTHQSKVFINGIGPVRVGMSVTQAAKAAGTKLVGDRPNKICYYVRPQEEKHIGLMISGGRVARVDVYKDSQITTVKGAKIGDPEARIKSLYPGQIQVSLHKYVPGGHYLTFVPKDPSDQNYRVIFETDGKRVTGFRSGQLPEVEYVEGCS
ncbi:hypothetical protein H6G76_02945 [Nostoc sp. FACHB-152]|uniref:hypothetical protein n=1 Tax=unclassified Nostoc TaxID=2593658 RepID=UPI0016843EBC|nr:MULTISPECIES: hypothetical protein [unclassified Nostoc]MBD2446129.1 hypothetical protein [Nostoc sp. FACHB-152]MBD2467361.1 hypothetical protein [Nostoc sp. FACHB-145]